jgi:hypothetical protein
LRFLSFTFPNFIFIFQKSLKCSKPLVPSVGKRRKEENNKMLKIKLIHDSSIRVVPRAVAEKPSFGIPDIIAYALDKFDIPAEQANLILLTSIDNVGNRLAVSTSEDLAAALAHAASHDHRSLKLTVGFRDEESSLSESSDSSETEGESDESFDQKDQQTGEFELVEAHQEHQEHRHRRRHRGRHHGEHDQEPVWMKYRRAARERKQKLEGGEIDADTNNKHSKKKMNKKCPDKGRQVAVDKLKSRLAVNKDKIRELRIKLKEERQKNRRLVAQLRGQGEKGAAPAVEGEHVDIVQDKHKHRCFGRRHGRHHKHQHRPRGLCAVPPAFAASMQVGA